MALEVEGNGRNGANSDGILQPISSMQNNTIMTTRLFRLIANLSYRNAIPGTHTILKGSLSKSTSVIHKNH
jgi:hypothetical protein